MCPRWSVPVCTTNLLLGHHACRPGDCCSWFGCCEPVLLLIRLQPSVEGSLSLLVRDRRPCFPALFSALGWSLHLLMLSGRNCKLTFPNCHLLGTLRGGFGGSIRESSAGWGPSWCSSPCDSGCVLSGTKPGVSRFRVPGSSATKHGFQVVKIRYKIYTETLNDAPCSPWKDLEIWYMSFYYFFK